MKLAAPGPGIEPLMPAPPAGFPKRSPSTTLVHQLGTDGVVFYVLFKYIKLKLKKKIFFKVPQWICTMDLQVSSPMQ